VAVGPQPGTVIPLTGMRGAIARSMHASLQEMAQLTHGYEAEVGALLALRDNLKREWAGTGLRVPSINDFVVRAAAHALLEHPMLNATIRDDGIHLLEEVHIGVAVAIPDGLVVPVVRDADRRGLVDIGEETVALATAAREGRLTLPQLEGATFVVTSLGSYGVDFFTPVVNTGNTGILGVGRVRDGVRWEGDVPHRTSVLTLSLSFDHRAVDGAPAAEFLRTVSGLLARPHLLLAG
jgi:pyruvate dehydrogenase E2 component (dihydrolipoamide acetyltransferase)